MLGASSFVVVMTDYTQSALTCTCQDAGFLGLYVNRRSCSVLQRQPQLDQQLLDEVDIVCHCLYFHFHLIKGAETYEGPGEFVTP